MDQWATVLTAVGLTTENMSFTAVMTTLSGWGKGEGDNPVFVSAAASVRALSARRGQVLYPDADPEATFLDPLQTVLLLAHITSRFGVVKSAKPQATALGLFDRLLGTGTAYAASAADDEDKGPCEALNTLFDTDNAVVKADSDFLRGELKNQAVDAVLKGGAKEVFEKATEAWGKAGSALSAIMLMLGARLTLTSDKSLTHFKHQAGSKAEHVMLTAKAEFDLKIAAAKLECYSLAGVSIPKAGPLEGFTIKWSAEQDQRGSFTKGGSAYLQTVHADLDKIEHGGKTNKEGISTLEVMPPAERPPGGGEKLTGSATFTAKLDKESFPLELGDLFSVLGSPFGFVIAKSFDIVKDVLTRTGLPSQSITIDVEYHGSDIIIAKGHATIELFLVQIPDAYVDLVSCTGIGGPFTGTGGFGGTVTEWLRTARLLKIYVPDETAGGSNKLSVTTNPNSKSQFVIYPGEGGAKFLDGVLTFFPPSSNNRADVLPGKQVGRPVGELEMLLNDRAYLFGDLVFPVYRVDADPRCEAVTYVFDQL